MLSDRDKRDLAEVFAAVLDARMRVLYSEIAHGFVEIVDGLMQDLAGIMEQQNEKATRAILQGRDKRTQEWLDRVLTRL